MQMYIKETSNHPKDSSTDSSEESAAATACHAPRETLLHTVFIKMIPDILFYIIPLFSQGKLQTALAYYLYMSCISCDAYAYAGLNLNVENSNGFTPLQACFRIRRQEMDTWNDFHLFRIDGKLCTY
jgi:hypothetical protein